MKKRNYLSRVQPLSFCQIAVLLQLHAALPSAKLFRCFSLSHCVIPTTDWRPTEEGEWMWPTILIRTLHVRTCERNVSNCIGRRRGAAAEPHSVHTRARCDNNACETPCRSPRRTMILLNRRRVAMRSVLAARVSQSFIAHPNNANS